MSTEPTSVLLVLTHKSTGDLLEDRLSRKDAQVTRVGDGEAAHKRIQNDTFDVAVAETSLPGRTGLELLRAAAPLDPPFVLMGRKGNDEEVIRAFDMGAFDYFTRPFAPHIVTARILRVPRLLSMATKSQLPSRE